MGSISSAKKMLAEAMNVKVLLPPQLQEGPGGHGDSTSVQETIVLAHGFGGTQQHWSGVVDTILRQPARCRRVVLLDWPGSCTTDLSDFDDAVASACTTPTPSLYHTFANLLVALLHELHLHTQPCTFVGHSMSAMIGCIAALHSPHLFNKLILVGASPRYLNDEGYYGGFEQDDVKQIYSAIEADFEGWARAFAAAVVGEGAGEAATTTYAQTLSSMRPEVARAMAEHIFESDHRGVVEELMSKRGEGEREGGGGAARDVEVHVLQTCKDLAVPLLVSDYLKRHLDHSSAYREAGGEAVGGRLEILQVAGHLPHLSAPHLFSSVLLRHLS